LKTSDIFKTISNTLQRYHNSSESKEKPSLNSEIFFKSTENKIKSLSKNGKLLLERLISLNRSYNQVIIEQQTLASNIKCNRKTVVRLTKVLSDLGLICKIDRGFKKACQYKVDDLLLKNYKKFIKYFPKLKHVKSKFQMVSEKWSFDYPSRNVGIATDDQRYNYTVYDEEDIEILSGKDLSYVDFLMTEEEYQEQKFGHLMKKNVPQVNSLLSVYSLKQVIINNNSKSISKQSSAREENSSKIYNFNEKRQEEQNSKNGKSMLELEVEKFHKEMNEYKQKEKERMENENTILITPAIARAKEILDLTLSGQCRLRMFEDEAIMFALDKLEKTSDIIDEFDFVFEECKRYSSTHRLWLNSKRAIALKESYQVAEDNRVYVNSRRQRYAPKPNKYDKPFQSQQQQQKSFNPVPQELRDQAKQFELEDKEISMLNEAVQRKIEQRPMLEVMVFINMLTKTKQGQYAMEVMGKDIVVSPSFFECIQRVSEPEKEYVYTNHPYLKDAKIGTWPAFTIPVLTRQQKNHRYHTRSRKYLSDEEYKRCLIITAFKPVVELEETEPVKLIAPVESSNNPNNNTTPIGFKSVASLIRELVPETKITPIDAPVDIPEVKASNRNNVRLEWNPYDEEDILPF
jgi:hypothetical protein